MVRKLLVEQFASWAHLPLVRIGGEGTDHAIYRLGSELVLRFPRYERAVEAAAREWRWLPLLGPRLPLQVPEPLAIGEPGAGYSWPWVIHRWLAGTDALESPPYDVRQAALRLCEFILALQHIESADGPRPTNSSGWDSGSLAGRDERVRRALAGWEDRLDTAAFLEVWESALHATTNPSPEVWLHGDLHPGNLIVRGGQLSAVIDWGGLAVGDPAHDLVAAWGFVDRLGLSALELETAFRRPLDVDESTWARGRGWALSVWLGPPPASRSQRGSLGGRKRVIEEIIEDFRRQK